MQHWEEEDTYLKKVSHIYIIIRNIHVNITINRHIKV